MQGAGATTVAVVVITYRRPAFVDENLAHLACQSVTPAQVIVVDGSPDDETETVVARHPVATYIRNPSGAGNMTSSRNAALPLVAAEVIAFLDDDAYADADYVERLAEFCARRPDVSIGCGRALNGVPGEELRGGDGIGRLSPSGAISANFAADPGEDIEIDHGLGATMWIRTDLMRRLGGFREYFGGTSACEDTDLFLRARRLGHQPWLVRAAVVRHIAAPQEGGRRFDIRYTYWAAHNKALLIMADSGIASRRFVRASVAEPIRNLSYGGAWYRRVARTAVVVGAWLRGVLDALRMFGGGPVPPIGAYSRDSSTKSRSRTAI